MTTNTHESNTNSTNKKNAKLVYPELSYLITGILFEVHNKLGNRFQEKHYQRAVAIKLQELKIPFEKEIGFDVEFEGQKLGKFFADFIVDSKIILELKCVWKISPSDVKQVLRYLKTNDLKLGIIANFRHSSLELRRVVN